MEKQVTTPASSPAENAGMVQKTNTGGSSALEREQALLSRPQLNEPPLKDTPKGSASDDGCGLMRTDAAMETDIYVEYT